MLQKKYFNKKKDLYNNININNYFHFNEINCRSL